MKKVIAFIGSARKKNTFIAVQEFEKNLKSLGNIDFEYVFLNDYHLEFCGGCLACLNYGEQYCPLNDDREKLLEKMELSDGVIFATPNYSFHVSARIKNLLDRFAYFFHRPYFFGKTFTAIVTQGVAGGNDARKYLEEMGANFGYNIVKGTCVKTYDPMTENQQQKLIKEIKKASERFYKHIMRPSTSSPSLYRLMMFRISRNLIKNLDPKFRDHQYFKEKGWYKSDYYYDISLGVLKRLAGHIFDFLGRQIVKHQ